jgi:hypothetical protein
MAGHGATSHGVFLADLGENRNSLTMMDNRERGVVRWVRNEIAKQGERSIYRSRLWLLRILDERELTMASRCVTEVHQTWRSMRVKSGGVIGCLTRPTARWYTAYGVAQPR